MNKICVIAVILLALSACASDRSKHRKINAEDYLAKEITQDNIKLFTYSMETLQLFISETRQEKVAVQFQFRSIAFEFS